MGVLGVLQGAQHQAGGSVGDGRAVEHAEGRCDRPGLQDGVQGDGLPELGVGVQGAVEVAVDREGGDLLPGGHSVVDHALRHHGVQTGEGDSHPGLPLGVRGGVEDAVDGHVVHVRHLLRASDEDHVVHSGRDGHYGLPEGHASGRSAGLDPGGGDVVGRHSRVVGDQRVDVLLLDELPGGHVPDEHSVDLATGQVGVAYGLDAGLDADGPERFVPELAELGDSGPYDCYVPHVITPA